MTGLATRNRAPAPQQPKVDPRVVPQAPARPMPTPAAAPQPKLGGLDPAERPVAQGQEDLLDIPAFLRRQAN